MQNRTLFFGDNLEILKKKIPTESFDLIYLDPPFNSNRSYNVLFKEGLQDSPAQVHAFEDTWHWTPDSKATFDHLVRETNEDISSLMQALEKLVGPNDMLAYLTMMTVRLIELHRVLKKTGSIYLHCDPTASHYLKIILDAIFGKHNFRNEIIWKRGAPKSNAKQGAKHFGRSTDTILFYTKIDSYYFNPQYKIYTDEKMIEKFKYHDEKGSFCLHPLDAPGGASKGNPKYEFLGVTRYWRYSKDNMQKLLKEGKIHQAKPGNVPTKKYYDWESKGVEIQNLWDDIINLRSQNIESLGYPTQKPQELLERIIDASSKEGDWILDPFCGCGTTVSAAEKLKRNWVGIDITALAINLIKYRLKKMYGLDEKQIFIDGFPQDLGGAKELFKKDPFQFEYWAVDLVNARPAGGKSEANMKGADKGIDGVMYFIKNADEEYGKALVQVKGGGVKRNDIATLKGDVDREKAEAGVFITLENPTKPMIQEAVEAGTFSTPLTIKTSKPEYPKIQILTIEEILKGKMPDLPQGLSKAYYKEASASKVDKSLKQKLMI